jgi:hypothetical protein
MNKQLASAVLSAWILWVLDQYSRPLLNEWTPKKAFTTKVECESFALTWVDKLSSQGAERVGNLAVTHMSNGFAAITSFHCFPENFNPSQQNQRSR